MQSYIKNLQCAKCQRKFNVNTIHHLCPCGYPLLVNYELDAVKKNTNPEIISRRRNDIWRYYELLPVQKKENIVTLGEGMTPLLPLINLGKVMDSIHLYMKDESLLPTGTFKARGAAVGISKAKELGVSEIIMPSNGNAGAAWGLYSARAGINFTVVVPNAAPNITNIETHISGSTLYSVNGLISDAGNIVAKAVNEYGIYDVSTLKEPYRIEGKKTMGYEIIEQLEWEVPDVILYPTGGGVGIIGIYKALKELNHLGWLKEKKMPRLVAVQASGCAPIVTAWEQNKTESTLWEKAETVAFGINVPKALGDFLVLDAIYQTNGCAIAIEDADILKEQRRVAKLEGLFICPEGAAAVHAANKLRARGWIKREEKVVILNTGSGIKYPNTLSTPKIQILEKDSTLPFEMRC